MSYIIQSDLLRTIQDVNLQQIISNDATILERAILSAEAEAKSYLRQKYLLEQEFTDTLLYSFTKIYYTNQRFFVNGSPFQGGTSHSLGDLVSYNNQIYQCKLAYNTNNPPTDTTYWTLLGAPNSIYTVQTYSGGVVPAFEYSNVYRLGDKVYWKGKVYTCRVATATITHEVALQYGFYQNLPQNNVAPDDTVNGLQYWGGGVAYSVPAGNLISPSNFFVADDNRDAQMVMMIIDVALFHLHSRIAPRNIPELRVKRYEAAVEWFRMCAEGKITPSLPLIQPKQGNRIRFGGNVKNINNY